MTGDFSNYLTANSALNPQGKVIQINDPTTGLPLPGDIIPTTSVSSVAVNLAKYLPISQALPNGIYWLDDAKQVPDTQVVTYDYGDFMLVWELRSFSKNRPLEGTQFGAAFHGNDGALVIGGSRWTAYNKDGEIVETVKDTGGSHE